MYQQTRDGGYIMRVRHRDRPLTPRVAPAYRQNTRFCLGALTGGDVRSRCDPATCIGTCESDACGNAFCIQDCTEQTCSGINHCVDNTCVRKLCDMAGADPCADSQRCAPQEAGANSLGCVTIKCDEPGGGACNDPMFCDPDDPQANAYGCAHLACDYGCVWPDEEFV